MNTLPPSSAPPTQPAVLPPAPGASTGCGCCFGAGCLTLFVVGLVALVALCATAWFVLGFAVTKFTSANPAPITAPAVSDEQFSAADAKLNQLRTALRSNQSATIAFSAADLNALLQRHPQLAPRKGKVHVEITDGVAEVEMSMPLQDIDLPRVKHRWFNMRASFTFLYAEEGFDFEPRWVEANGHRLTGGLLDAAGSSFNRDFTRRFKKAMREDAGDSDFWRNVKTMTLDRDQLVVMTKGPDRTL